MLTEAVDKQRAINFYRWAVTDAEREVREEYPLLRRVQNVQAITYRRLAEAKPLGEQLRLFQALVNWGHSAARALLGEELSTEDAALIEDWEFEVGLRASAVWQELYDRGVADPPYNRKRFGRMLVETLEPLLGPAVREGKDLVFVTPLSGWHVGTRVQRLERRNAFRYWQNVLAVPDEYAGMLSSPSQNGTNFLSWLGFSPQEIDVPSEKDEGSATEALRLLCSHYLNAMPQVLEGLTADVMRPGEWDGIHWWQRLGLNPLRKTAG